VLVRGERGGGGGGGPSGPAPPPPPPRAALPETLQLRHTAASAALFSRQLCTLQSSAQLSKQEGSLIHRAAWPPAPPPAGRRARRELRPGSDLLPPWHVRPVPPRHPGQRQYRASRSWGEIRGLPEEAADDVAWLRGAAIRPPAAACNMPLPT
jgi:hypothetical protein